ncbi:MAG: hypothetical protein L3J03_10315 [Desulfobacterales bacterium]|nr:hypothetical protein [Desulfobacterales bacterium]
MSGCNILFGRMIWGHFRVREAVCDRFGGRLVLEIDYDRQENGPLTRRIRDHLVYLEKQRIYLGRFNLCYRHTLHFYGYFSLTKVTAD